MPRRLDGWRARKECPPDAAGVCLIAMRLPDFLAFIFIGSHRESRTQKRHRWLGGGRGLATDGCAAIRNTPVAWWARFEAKRCKASRRAWKLRSDEGAPGSCRSDWCRRFVWPQIRAAAPIGQGIVITTDRAQKSFEMFVAVAQSVAPRGRPGASACSPRTRMTI